MSEPASHGERSSSVHSGATAPAVRLVDQYLADAVSSGASDLHIEPHGATASIRVRIDGRLHVLASPPTSLLHPLLARLRVLARVDLAERRLPQDGRFSFRHGKEIVEVRAAFMPVHGGEKIALRLLRADTSCTSLVELGLDAAEAAVVRRMLTKPSGLVIVAGPTGSGKTTTLYAALESLRTPDISIVTAEDPVERNLEGTAQIPVDDDCGRTFAVVLRSILRLDPDVLMVGEMRDGESARIACRAALTGHRVLTTLHTADTREARIRLLDMGVPEYLVTATMSLVVAQRLLRRLCECCRTRRAASDEEREMFRKAGLPAPDCLADAMGCNACSGRGYRGRLAVFELLAFDEPGQSSPRPHATLLENGLRRAAETVTSIAEVLSQCPVART